MDSVTIIHQDCDPSLSDDRELPYTAYLVEYIQGETTHYDITMCGKKVDLFDHYYDKYKKDFVGFTQTEGRKNPKLYGYKSPVRNKKK